MSDFQHAVMRLRTWLDDHFDGDGRCIIDPQDARFYAKAPYLLHTAGLRAKGAAAARFAFANFIDECGDMVSDEALENRVYGMGWLLLGAVGLEQCGLVRVLADRLCRLQDPQCGGVLLPDEEAGEEVAEVCFSGGVGMALAVAGRIEQAQRMADRFVDLLDAQPGDGRYYNRFRRDGTVVPRPAAGAWDKVYDPDRDEQRPANFATVLNTLVWVGRATGSSAYFAAARRYVDMVYGHRLDPAGFGRATKFGWSMLNLRQDIGDADLLVKAQQLGEVLVEQQNEDGLWHPRPGDNADAPDYARLSYSSDCAMTVLALAQLV